MKVGVFAAMFQNTTFTEALDYIVSVGVDAVEIAGGGYVGNAHCKPALLLSYRIKLAIHNNVWYYLLPLKGNSRSKRCSW